ncbi:MAG TPA: hypothetical protein VN841_15945 [Bryobacteraceae bacterium]|nr:hypothetical protein [Bryobacteraceae bacterium]
MTRRWTQRWIAIWLGLMLGGAVGLRAQNLPSPNAPLTPSAAALAWTKFEDPLEKAYTLDVPQGWTVKGGMFRLGYSDERIMLDLRSPDGKVSLRLGDVSIPTYFFPDQLHREGEVYDLGAQAQGTIARYRTGQEFAAVYAQARFKSQCSGLTAEATAGAEPADGYLLPEGNKASSGQVRYGCQSSAGARTAYVWSKTTLTGQLWQVQLASFLAAPEQTPMALSVVARCERSFKLSPDWRERQKKLDEEGLAYQRARQQARLRQLSQQVAQFEVRMQAMQNQVNGFLRGQARQAAQVEAVGNILTGITPTVDPLGNPRNVYTGPKSGYWTNGRGDVVNSDTSPGPGWQPLRPTQ